SQRNHDKKLPNPKDSEPVRGTNRWSDHDRSLIAKDECEARFPNHGWIAQNLDPKDAAAGTFDLFYFSQAPMDPSKPTTLFVHGGPGGIVTELPSVLEPFGDGVNQVYFH